MKKISLSLISIIVAVLIIAAASALIFVSVNNYSSSYSEKKLKEVKLSVLSYTVQCYALEGKYPPDLDYLHDNYGLQLERDKFIYHYEMFASNILPDIKILAKEKAGE